MKTYVLTFILFWAGSSLSAQDMARVKGRIDTLCAPEMHGRSWYGQGETKAAQYLCEKFKQAGLLPLGLGYMQYFNFDINTFPKKVFLRSEQKIWQPGAEYLANCSSSKGKGRAQVVRIDTLIFSNEKARLTFLIQPHRLKAWVVDEKFSRPLMNLMSQLPAKNRPSLIVELKDKKLTHSISDNACGVVYIELLKKFWDPKCRQLEYKIDAVVQKGYRSQNVIGYIPGTQYKDSFLIVSAHYDHLGRMGKDTYFPGANDNASGVTMMLEMAHYFKANPSKYGLIFIAFGAEEAGLIGSRYFTEHPLVSLQNIRFLLNLDLISTGSEGLMVVNGSVFTNEFSMLEKANGEKAYVPEIKKRGKAANSDHYWFTEKGVKSFFVYTLPGVPAYHDVADVPSLLTFQNTDKVFLLLTRFMEAF